MSSAEPWTGPSSHSTFAWDAYSPPPRPPSPWLRRRRLSSNRKKFRTWSWVRRRWFEFAVGIAENCIGVRCWMVSSSIWWVFGVEEEGGRHAKGVQGLVEGAWSRHSARQHGVKLSSFRLFLVELLIAFWVLCLYCLCLWSNFLDFLISCVVE